MEPKLAGAGQKLSANEWSALIRKCQVAKEILLQENAPEEMSITLEGAGKKLIGVNRRRR